jgi:hypothetical protein
MQRTTSEAVCAPERPQRGSAPQGLRRSVPAQRIDDKGDGYEGSITHGVQGAPHHLPFVRIGRTRHFGRGLRPLRLMRIAAGGLRAGDLGGHSWAARRPWRPPLRMRPPRDAGAARWSIPLPGLRLGGPSRGKSQARDHRYLMVGYFAPGPVLRRRWNRQDAPPPRAAGSGGRSYVTGSLRRMGISTQRLRGATR